MKLARYEFFLPFVIGLTVKTMGKQFWPVLAFTTAIEQQGIPQAQLNLEEYTQNYAQKYCQGQIYFVSAYLLRLIVLYRHSAEQ